MLRLHETIVVKLPGTIQTILVGEGIRSLLIPRLRESQYNSYYIFVDSNFAKLQSGYLEQLRYLLNAEILEIDALELTKGMSFLQFATELLWQARCDRRSCVIGIGGGIVGDSVGFLASVYMRGISMAFVPTTLMGQADTIIGKVALSSPCSKNVIGSFYSPELTICDTEFLQSLHSREICLGFAEIIKHALISGGHFFSTVRNLLQKPVSSCWKEYPLSDLVSQSIITKRHYVINDPFDKYGQHKALSLGHTFGNAIEAISNYEIRHGEAVALGIRAASAISHQLGLMSQADMLNIEWLLKQAQLVHVLPAHISISLILDELKRDKLSHGGRMVLVLPVSGGGTCVKENIPVPVVENALITLRSGRVD